MNQTSESVAILVKALVGSRPRPQPAAPVQPEESLEVSAFLREEPRPPKAPLDPVTPASVKLFAGGNREAVFSTPAAPVEEVLSGIEERRAVRYSALISLPGLFDGTEVRIKDLSSTGFQIEHSDRIPLRTSRMLRFVHPRSFDADHQSLGIPDRLFESHYTEFRCTTVWSRLHRETNNGPAMYRTGITAAPGESGPLLLPFLMREYLQPDSSDGLKRKQRLVRERRERMMARSQDLANQHFLVRIAASWLRAHPVEMTEWRRRARFALGSGSVPHANNFALGYTVEVVAIWQFIDRVVSLATIRNALSTSNEGSVASNG